MESCGDRASLSTENVLTLHRKEKKELQAKIQALKKTATKSDKKKKKEVADQIQQLEDELSARHAQELAAICSEPSENNCPDTEQIAIGEPEPEVPQLDKVSRAQKRRNKKDSEAREREKRIQEQDVENRRGPRVIEMDTIKKNLVEYGLEIHTIPADGNCLYCAINHQLQITGRTSRTSQTVKNLRKLTSDFMLEHREDFIPFMCNDESDSINEENFDSYCKEVANSKLWGGQLEIKALSNALECPIRVIQASGPPTMQGENFKGQPLTITYHRHLFRLGEHYNSTVPGVVEGNYQDDS